MLLLLLLLLLLGLLPIPFCLGWGSLSPCCCGPWAFLPQPFCLAGAACHPAAAGPAQLPCAPWPTPQAPCCSAHSASLQQTAWHHPTNSQAAEAVYMPPMMRWPASDAWSTLGRLYKCWAPLRPCCAPDITLTIPLQSFLPHAASTAC
jgi:hypothetical protein